MKNTILLILIQSVITLTAVIVITNEIDKHSIHPVYGNYTKVDNLGHACQPWDACRHKDDKYRILIQTRPKVYKSEK